MTATFLFGIAVFIALNASDVTTTFSILELGGSERNPFARFILCKFGWLGLATFKVITTVTILTSLIYTFSFAALFSVVSVWCYNAVMTWVVFHNVRVYRRMKYEIYKVADGDQ